MNHAVNVPAEARMGNDIARQFAHLPPAEAAEAIALHIESFWDPRMRRALTEYVYFRDNVAGVQREWWYHRAGCGLWFVAERDTRTNDVLSTAVPTPRR